MLPVQKKSRSHTRSKRAHKALRPPHVVECPGCNKPKLPHAACDSCGYVRPGLSLEVKKKKER